MRTTYTYDAAGNRTSEVSPTRNIVYTWDASGQMIAAHPAAGIVSFTYNADGQRIVKDSFGTGQIKGDADKLKVDKLKVDKLKVTRTFIYFPL